MALRPSSPERLSADTTRPVLCAVIDARELGSRPGDFARQLFESGVDWIQLRDRSLSSDSLFRIARLLVDARKDGAGGDRGEVQTDSQAVVRSARRVIVNRRVDIALSVGANGVHLGFDAIDEGRARELLPEDACIGRSLHALDEIESASPSAGGLRSYAHLAPIWNPISKEASRPALGLELLSKAVDRGLPILAQGGINPERAAEVARTGAAGIAVTGAITAAGNPMAAARQLREALDTNYFPEG